MRTPRGVWAVVALAAACHHRSSELGASPEGGTDAQLRPSGAHAASGTPGGGPSAAQEGGDASAAVAPACPAELQDVYALSDKKELWRFSPGTHEFKRVGALKCPVGVTEASFAVDRSGTAWMLGADRTLFKVDVRDASCTVSKFPAREHAVYQRFTGTFSSDTRGSAAETFYAADDQGWGATRTDDSVGLATIDTTTLTLAPHGVFVVQDAMGVPCALAGTGDARLFGVFATGKIAEIDKERRTFKRLLPTKLPPAAPPPTAYWGGALWLLRPGPGQGYVAVKVDTGVPQPFQDKLPADFVAAGSSTCAPTAAPP